MLLVNFNLVITCVLHATPLRTIMRAITHAQANVFGGIKCWRFSKKNSPIRQMRKIPTKVSGYTVLRIHIPQLNMTFTS